MVFKFLQQSGAASLHLQQWERWIPDSDTPHFPSIPRFAMIINLRDQSFWAGANAKFGVLVPNFDKKSLIWSAKFRLRVHKFLILRRQ